MTIRKGQVLAEWTHPVEWGKVREFAHAVHDPRCGREPPVPPVTFPVVLSADFVEKLVCELIPLDRRRTVHGEQEYEYVRPLRVGQMVRCRARIVRDETKQGRRGGRMRIITVETELQDADTAERLGFERMTAVEQEAQPG